MELFETYRHLGGSYGQFHLRLAPSLVEQLCEILQTSMQGSLQASVENLRVSSTGTNRFRIRAGLSSGVFQRVGKLFFKLLREEGVEIQIEQSSATIENPAMTGSWTTGIAGKKLGIPELVREMNAWLDAGNVLEVESSRRGLAKFDMILKLNPFLLLRQCLPVGIGHHVTQVQVQTQEEFFVVDCSWNHSGPPPKRSTGSSAENLIMNPELQSLLDKLKKSQFAELKGSRAKLHLNCSEGFFNEALTLALPWLKRTSPAASAVKSAHVKGSVGVDLKIQL
jgi:hypothetical protein